MFNELNKLLCAAAVALSLVPRWATAQTPASEAYVWRNVAIVGGGFVTGIIFHPTAKNLMYARTDVGGAYRWDDAVQKWTPLTDWLGPDDSNLAGIESVAVDPADPQRLYLAAGTYSGGPAAILRSDDQGRTFRRANVPFKMGGNEAGRFNGERLAVDPNDGNILFFGSRHDGLWKSSDGAATWQKAAEFPVKNAADPRSRAFRGFGQQAVGIVSVVFDGTSGKAGRPTPKIFAAVSTAETNLFVSTDAGATWQPVAGQSVGLRPNHAVRATDGKVYLTYGREPGPNTMTDGAVWEFDPKENTWTDITPLKSPDGGGAFGYWAVAVDAQQPGTVVVTTFAHWRPHDLIFRSVDGGAHWSELWRDDTKWDHAPAPYTMTRRPHWMGSVAINPHDSGQVLFTTGYGIWNCNNATQTDAGEPARWVFLDNGLEETVPLALISPPQGAHLLSGVGDIDGFRHDNLEVSPAGSFGGPRFGNTEDLAFAAKESRFMVRAGTADNHAVRAAISQDGGSTWRELENEPPTGNGSGTIAISADAKTIVWTPRGGEPYRTRDRGSNWVACAGLGTGVRVTADTVNPDLFYAFDARAQKFCCSTNGAATFTATAAVLQGPEHYRYGGGVGVGATPGIEGDIWLVVGGGGLFHSTNGGVNFAKLDGVRSADSLGQGRAARGKSVPALFLAGTVGGVQALFRSDDAGGNWVRISDDQHQYGYISRVTGDPRIYGRVYFATGGRGVIYGDIKDAQGLGKN